MTSLTSIVMGALVATIIVARAATAQEFPLTDPNGLVARDVKAEAVDVLGKKAVRLLTLPDKEEGFAFLPGVDFQDGTIDADISLKTLTPPGVRMPGFIGIAFRARPDASSYELFYVRPNNSLEQDQARRNHSVQYTSAPGFGWSYLRRAWPWLYETYAPIESGAWTHLTIEVAGRVAKLYLNRSPQPTLIVNGLKGQDLHGGVALWGYASEESYFSNVRVKSATPQSIANGSDAAGTWQVKLATDNGPFQGTLQLRRDGKSLTGTWSGDLGKDLPVSGTWRDGYIELTFTGQWLDQQTKTVEGPAPTTLAGWIDGASGTGRTRIDGHAEGQWMATRTP